MQLMWTALTQLLLIAAAAAAATIATTHGGCPPSCGGVDIPYPFGIGRGCFRKGFEIECLNNGPVLAGTSLRVVKLTLDPDESQVMLPIGWQCYNATSTDDAVEWSHAETTMNKDGVYRISNTHNMLVVLGCNTLGYTGSERTEGGTTNYAFYSGCMSYCNNTASPQDGLCDGVGCCHVNIPPGLTDNYFDFREYEHALVMDFSPCDYAFLVDRNNYTFRRSDLKMDTKRTSPVWLDWAIRGNSSISGDIPSCKQAAKTGQYACVSAHSECVDSSNGPGYNCKCSSGYEGDAYLPNGCTNIDECADPAKYPCYGVCTDTQGSYQCKCPAGSQSHDPITERCTQQFPLGARIAVGAISGILVLAFLSFIFILRKEKRKAKNLYEKNGGPTLEDARSIKIYKKEKLKPILRSSNLIGKGGFGEVYKGDLDGVPVAIKKPIGDNVQMNSQFPNEVIIQSEVIHKNIVSLMGCCLEVDTPMLVYEFVANGSLDDILHKDKNQLLSLDVRLSILQESANGLAYMHSGTNKKILHGDVKPANILLGDNFQPKISDFGISRLIPKGKEHTMNIIGDMTYMDPVYVQTGRLTDRSDVYSFGIVILEVISRKKATHSDGNSLLNSFLDCHRESNKATELFDKEIATTGDMEILDKLQEIAMQCLDLEADQRPSMTVVARHLFQLNGSN